jgi:MerR family transcriptional regulator, light-induced transcriptional regulator
MGEASARPDHTAQSRRAEASKHVERLVSTAAATAVAEIRSRHETALCLPGAAGRHLTAQELELLVSFLSGSIATGRTAFFTRYVHWMASELEGRNLSPRLLDDALQALAGFFADALDRESAFCTTEMIAQAREVLARGVAHDLPADSARQVPLRPHVSRLTRELASGQIADAWAECDAAWQDSHDYAHVATQVLQPALYEIGLLWERNEITVDQEHLATSIAEAFLARLYRRAISRAVPNGRSVLLAAGPRNRHVMGLRMVADAFALAGWTVHHLSVDTTTDAIAAQIERARPEVIGFSASLIQHLPPQRQMIEKIRSNLGSRCPAVLVGGLPINHFSDAAAWLGADICAADARSAVGVV